jgi:uncharacterized protein (DUF58 family)
MHRWKGVQLNWSRLNHVLIPSTKEERDRFRQNRFTRWLIGPIARTWFSLTVEGRGLFGLALLASLVGLDVLHGQTYWLWAACLSLLAASVLARPWMGLKKVSIQIDGPKRVAVGAPVQFQINLVHQGSQEYADLRVQRPFLPWDGAWLEPAPRVARLKPGDRASCLATARFLERGPHHLDPFSVGALVPLGLSVGPARESRGVRFMVVPPIAPVSELQWPDRFRHQSGGVKLASRTGESLEVAGLRDWREGDRLRDLSARGWARRGQPVVREYQQEYFSRIAVVFDPDGRGSSERAFEASIALTAGIIEFLIRGESLVDLFVGGPNAGWVPLGRSRGGLDRALDALAAVRSRPAFCETVTPSEWAQSLEGCSAVFLIGSMEGGARSSWIKALERLGLGIRWIRVADGPEGEAPSGSGQQSGCLTARSVEDAIHSRSGLRL